MSLTENRYPLLRDKRAFTPVFAGYALAAGYRPGRGPMTDETILKHSATSCGNTNDL